MKLSYVMLLNGDTWQALISLAQRNYPNTREWYAKSDSDIVECLICNLPIHWLDVIRHGLNHLKEKGLLVFI